jgi:cell division protein FtsA
VSSNIVVAGLDIGSTKVCAVLAERREGGSFEITGIGVAPCNGMKSGVVTNIEATTSAIEKAITAAVMMAGQEATSLWTGIGGKHIDSINSHGVVAVTGRNKEQREISEPDIARVLDAAHAVVIPDERQILEVVPQSYTINYEGGIRNPLGMLGMRLEVEVHIITCSMTAAQNLVKCVNRAGYHVDTLVLDTLAAGRAALSSQEKEVGVAIVDIGGSTTSVLAYLNNAPYSTATIPLGGAQVTGDISQLVNLPFAAAEKIKCEVGTAWEALVEPGETVLVPGIGGRPPRPVSKEQLNQIIQPRMTEILCMAREELAKTDLLRLLGGGIVLTGGGASLSGVAELAQSIFGMQVRVGEPLIGGALEKDYKKPVFATAVGLAIEGFEHIVGPLMEGADSNAARGVTKREGNIFTRFFEFIKDNFF